jgi:hypothetical protein
MSAGAAGRVPALQPELAQDDLEGLVELVCEVVLQTVFEIGFDAWRHRKPSGGPGIWGLLVWGAAAGGLSSWLVPHRLLGVRGPIPGLSLLLAARRSRSPWPWRGGR